MGVESFSVMVNCCKRQELELLLLTLHIQMFTSPQSLTTETTTSNRTLIEAESPPYVPLLGRNVTAAADPQNTVEFCSEAALREAPRSCGFALCKTRPELYLRHSCKECIKATKEAREKEGCGGDEAGRRGDEVVRMTS
jgi:hypothetical protein